MQNHFEKDKFYVMSPPGDLWSEYVGPFNTQNEAINHLSLFAHEYSSPEMLKMTLVFFDGQQLNLVKTENGTIINGNTLIGNRK